MPLRKALSAHAYLYYCGNENEETYTVNLKINVTFL